MEILNQKKKKGNSPKATNKCVGRREEGDEVFNKGRDRSKNARSLSVKVNNDSGLFKTQLECFKGGQTRRVLGHDRERLLPGDF
eukprot:126031-Hanusia_phi.AAC.1